MKKDSIGLLPKISGYIIVVAMLLMFGMSNVAYSQSTDGDILIGVWKTEEHKSDVKIYKYKGKYYGKIIWLKEPLDDDGNPKLDRENSTESLRSKPIVGLNVLKYFDYNSKSKKWEDGKIYDPENGKTYKCKIKRVNDNEIEIRGFIGISLIGRTTVWTRK